MIFFFFFLFTTLLVNGDAAFYAGECPATHRYAYLNGEYCCANEEERVAPQDRELCDGSKIGIDSKCCSGSVTRCPSGTCSNYKTDEGWLSVTDVKSEEIDYDLQSFPLLIKTNTDSTVGSKDSIELRLYDEDEKEIGRIEIQFSSPEKYDIHNCVEKNFPSILPSDVNKIWNITKLSGPRIIIECNGKTVVDITMSDDTCKKAKWKETYNKDVKKIEFRGSDKASDEYYRPGCTGINPDWLGVKTTAQFPIQTGTLVHLHCFDQSELKGDKIVTCKTGTEFTFLEKPDCSVDGGWSDFSDWTTCSEACGGGEQTRSRTCSNPAPARGGEGCTGEHSETIECNKHSCPGECPDLTITGGEAKVSYEKNTDWIEVATVTCLKPKRYALIGGKEVTCQSNNTWSATPECRLCGTNYFT